jgi:hypothetical protein
MKAAFRTLLGLGIVFAAIAVAQAEDKKPEAKETTLKGDLACAKCVFEVKGVKKCCNAIKVKDGDKETIYLFVDKGAGEKYHGAICKDTKKGSVTGVVSKKGKQALIKPSKDGVKFD